MYDEQFDNFLVSTLLSYQKYGYKDYIAYSTLVKNDIEQYQEYTIILSKNNISYVDNRFVTEGVSCVITLNGSEFKQSKYNKEFGSLLISDYSSLSSNAKNFEGTNTLALIEHNEVIYENLNNSISVVSMILAVFLVYFWLIRWSGNGGVRDVDDD